MDYEVVIGLETHCELETESKLWCGCSTRFGQEPNTQTCPVCLGMPGSLPVMNERAFELSLRVAMALDCTIAETCCFDRKNYYYPDLPKNYQISQDYMNLGLDGRLEIPAEDGLKSVGITNVHLEEDAGKNVHAAAGADFSLVDLNRAGTPLLEIVSEPDMRSVAEAEAFMHTLRRLLMYARVSDCRMEEGSLRFEPSISLRPKGSQGFGARVEIKNVNSMKAVVGALAYEIRRQTKALNNGEEVAMETRLWDADRGRTARMRSKEEAQDYRYFPDPDLRPVVVTDEMRERVRAEVPELPTARRRRFADVYGLGDYETQVLTDSREVADYFEAAVQEHDAPKSLANWIMNTVLAAINERGVAIDEFEVGPAELAALVKLQDADTINAQAARDVLEQMLQTGKSAPELVKELGLEQISDSGELGPVVEQVIEGNPQPVQDYLAGKKAAVGALVGQVMRATRGKADPKLVNQMLREKLDAMG
jgi:aspartyl-tRNA(Asn)/glutamyl-tRNA(Gln) amidotransferase subunit B